MTTGTGRKPFLSSRNSEASKAPSSGSLKTPRLSSCAAACLAPMRRKTKQKNGILSSFVRLQHARRRGSDRRIAAAGDLYRGEGELDAVRVERLLDHRVGAAADEEL